MIISIVRKYHFLVGYPFKWEQDKFTVYNCYILILLFSKEHFKGITNQKMIFPHNQDNHEWNWKKYILAYKSENLACISRFKLQKTNIYRLQRPFSSYWEAICSKLAHETHKIVMNHSWLVYHNDAFCVQAYLVLQS